MSIRAVIQELNELAGRGIVGAYAIGGAVGATFYLEPVATLDVDVFVALEPAAGSALIDPRPIFTFLSGRGYALEGEYVWIAGWPVQFLPSTGPLVDEALALAATIDVEGAPARVIRPEHLAAIALQTGRARDSARVLQFLESGALDRHSLEQIVKRHDLGETWRRFRRAFLREDT